MNKRAHLLNALLLGVGIGFIMEPSGNARTAITIVEITPPIILGTLLPDVDTVIGRHRKTLHNVPVLGFFLLYPIYFGNLDFVWVGILAHYILDMFVGTRGLALFYPLDREFTLPVAVSSNGIIALFILLVVTALELAAAGLLLSADVRLSELGRLLVSTWPA